MGTTRGTGSVWLRAARQTRDAPLTREKIVRAAITLLDERGLAGLTMRGLAERLDVGTTTLYWHVKTKDDVVELAADAIFAEVALPEAGDWRDRARGLLTGWRAAMLRHPWSAALVGRPMLGPNVLRRTEFLHATLAGAGFTGTDLVAAAHALANYTVGAALTRSSGAPSAGDAADEHIRARADAYPVLAAHVGPHDDDALFARGLDALLKGL